MAAVTICSDIGAQKNKVSHCFHCFAIYLPWSDGTGCHDTVFWMLSFKPAFLPSSFTFIKRIFSSSSLSVIRVMSSAYLRLLILSRQSWFQLLLHPAHDFEWCMYSAYKLSKQGDSIQYFFPSLEPVHCSIPRSNNCFLTCIRASQETSEMVW